MLTIKAYWYIFKSIVTPEANTQGLREKMSCKSENLQDLI